jgi:hypothetical protein
MTKYDYHSYSLRGIEIRLEITVIILEQVNSLKGQITVDGDRRRFSAGIEQSEGAANPLFLPAISAILKRTELFRCVNQLLRLGVQRMRFLIQT